MAVDEDPTQGRTSGELSGEDPTEAVGAVDPGDTTQGRTASGDDPTQGREMGEEPDEDPTQGRRIGEVAGEDPAAGA